MLISQEINKLVWMILAIFSNNSTDYLGEMTLTYLWSFGDDSTSTDINPSL